MKWKKFLTLCENTVTPILEEYCDLYPCTFEFNKKYMNSLYCQYQELRSFTHKYMNGKRNVLDRHKVSACIMLAIMRTELLYPIHFDDNAEMDKFYKINELVALRVGLSVLVSFCMEIAISDKNEERISMYEGEFAYPETEHGKGFLDVFSNSLFCINTEGKADVFLLATILYLLEKNHESLYKLRIQKSPTQPKT